MFASAFTPAESNVMAEVVGRYTDSTFSSADIGVDSLVVRFYPSEDRAIVWVGLTDSSFAEQLRAVSAFSSVRECYEDELGLELKFGEPAAAVPVAESTQVYAYTA